MGVMRELGLRELGLLIERRLGSVLASPLAGHVGTKTPSARNLDLADRGEQGRCTVCSATGQRSERPPGYIAPNPGERSPGQERSANRARPDSRRSNAWAMSALRSSCISVAAATRYNERST